MKIRCACNDIILVKDIKPHPYNRVVHPDKQIKALAKIISKNGQRSPIVISKLSGYVVKGHGRLEAIKLLGWEKCAVDFQDYESELEEFNDRIADNEIARYAEFQKDAFLEDLKKLDLDLEVVDFEEFGLVDFKLPMDNIDPSGKKDGGLVDLNKGKIKIFQEEVMAHFQRLTTEFMEADNERDIAEDKAIQLILSTIAEVNS